MMLRYAALTLWALCSALPAVSIISPAAAQTRPTEDQSDAQVLKPGECPEGRRMVGGRCLRAAPAPAPGGPMPDRPGEPGAEAAQGGSPNDKAPAQVNP
jgi:hypothetical protein